MNEIVAFVITGSCRYFLRTCNILYITIKYLDVHLQIEIGYTSSSDSDSDTQPSSVKKVTKKGSERTFTKEKTWSEM